MIMDRVQPKGLSALEGIREGPHNFGEYSQLLLGARS